MPRPLSLHPLKFDEAITDILKAGAEAAKGEGESKAQSAVAPQANRPPARASGRFQTEIAVTAFHRVEKSFQMAL